jgi:hypothetical protein
MSPVFWILLLMSIFLVIFYSIINYNRWIPLYKEHSGFFWIALGLLLGALSLLMRIIFYPEYTNAVADLNWGYAMSHTPLDPLAIVLTIIGNLSWIMIVAPLILYLFGYYDKTINTKEVKRL